MRHLGLWRWHRFTPIIFIPEVMGPVKLLVEVERERVAGLLGG